MATHHDDNLLEEYDGSANDGTIARWADWSVLVVLTFLSLLAGCVSTPSPAAEQVRLVNETSFIKDCRLLGEVRSGSAAPLMGWTAHTLTNARTALRDEAVKKGGNMVLVTQTNANPWGTWMYGEAYVCPGP